MSWSTGLFECHKAEDIGVICCVNHICCAPCIWISALQAANVPQHGIYTGGLAIGYTLAAVGSYSHPLVLEPIGAGIRVCTFTMGRFALIEKYGITENVVCTVLSRVCCGICAQVQEINTIVKRESLKYRCLGFERDTHAHENADCRKLAMRVNAQRMEREPVTSNVRNGTSHRCPNV